MLFSRLSERRVQLERARGVGGVAEVVGGGDLHRVRARREQEHVQHLPVRGRGPVEQSP